MLKQQRNRHNNSNNRLTKAQTMEQVENPLLIQDPVPQVVVHLVQIVVVRAADHRIMDSLFIRRIIIRSQN